MCSGFSIQIRLVDAGKYLFGIVVVDWCFRTSPLDGNVAVVELVIAGEGRFQLGFGWIPIDRCSKELQSHSFLLAENGLHGLKVDSLSIVGVSELSTEPLIIDEGIGFVVESSDEESSARDVEQLGDSVDSLNDQSERVEIDPSFLFDHVHV
ncbi:hypothetical protein [Halococcus morrhuae]|uniref:hypothetical protein n=1 Tax=Halococcus morrhuae TaxID=2250 RepID=UPI00135F10D8|nr:hypothetical protein [Halococcus morrhuae]